MSPQTLVVILLLFGVGMVWYSTAKLRDKIYCSFRRIDKTKIEKFVPKNARYVIFDGGKYKIDTKRITLLWWNRGFNHFFPQRVPSLDFSWYSEVPHDPDQFEDTWDTPESRNAASSEEDWKGFNKGMSQQVGKKTGMLTQYMPMIALILVLVVGAVLYMQMQGMTARMDMLEQMRSLSPGG